MGRRVIALLSTSFMAIAPGALRAETARAPSVLTSAEAHWLTIACPSSSAYAAALARGMTRPEAVAGSPSFARCAAAIRLPEFAWKTRLAEYALAGVELSLARLDDDPIAAERATKKLDALQPGPPRRFRSVTECPDTNGPRWFLAVDDPCARPGRAIDAQPIDISPAFR